MPSESSVPNATALLPLSLVLQVRNTFVLALGRSWASTAGRRLNPGIFIDNGFPGARDGADPRRDFALKLPMAVGVDDAVLVQVDPGLSTDQGVLNSYGGVTAALKRAVELQPAAEGRSFQVVIGGERTGQSQRLMEADFSR